MNVVHGSLKGGQFTTNGVAIQTAVTGQADKVNHGVRPEYCSYCILRRRNIIWKIYTNELIGDHALVTLDWGGRPNFSESSKRLCW